MAIVTGNLFLAGVSGKVKNMVIKQVGTKTVLCSVPNMDNRILSEKQKESTMLMKYAIKFARKIIADPKQKEAACKALSVPPNKVFRAIVKEFMLTKGKPRSMDAVAS
ncbi:MAG: hypothetical protein ABI480_15780 [Chitinophagaceae bacterium]